MTDIEKVAIQFFNAYNDQGPNPWKTFNGMDVPKWAQLNDQVRAKWMAVVECAVRLVSNDEFVEVG